MKKNNTKKENLYQRLGRIDRKTIKKELIATLGERRYDPYEIMYKLMENAHSITKSTYISEMEKILSEYELKVPEYFYTREKKFIRNTYYGMMAMGGIKESLLPLYRALYDNERMNFFNGCWSHRKMKGIWKKGIYTIIKELIEKGEENLNNKDSFYYKIDDDKI